MESEMCFDPHLASVADLDNIIAKEVEIDLGLLTKRGWVQSIDPISRSFMLMKFNDDSKWSEVFLIPGCNTKSVKVFSTLPTENMKNIMNNLFRKKEIHFSKEEIEKRREALCVWLSGNRVPYTVTDNLSIEVLQLATVKPPYCTESIRCKNEVVLDKVMKLIRSAPGLEIGKE